MKRVLIILLVLAFLLSAVLYSPGATLAGPLLEPGAPDGPPIIFLPFLGRSSGGLTVSGQVLDAKNQPVSAVRIVDNRGNSTLTNSEGKYTLSVSSTGAYALAPSHPDYVFSPSMVDVQVQGRVSGQNFTAITPGILNGGFETNTAWEIPVTAWSAGYSTLRAHTGARSMRTGIVDAEDDIFSYSDTYQVVSIPEDINDVILRLWVYPTSGETTAAAAEDPRPVAGLAFDELQLANDAQYVLVMDPDSEVILETLLFMRSNAAEWTRFDFDLTGYRGEEIRIQIGTFNNGSSGETAMFIDDVSLETTTPAPGTCSNLFENSDFEQTAAWEIPVTAWPAGYSTLQALSGARSMRTGLTASDTNKFSYSDAYQIARIPSDAASAHLRLSIYPISGEVAQTSGLEAMAAPEPPPLVGTLASDMALAQDAQYVLVLNANTQAILETLLFIRSNNQSWIAYDFDLTRYRGQNIRIQYGTFNDGQNGKTVMFVDDAALDVCASGAPTPTPTPTPSPTPLPGCTDLFENSGFETTEVWEIPTTAFSAGYSTARAYAGARSMRTGIVFNTHNRFSYSDFRQTVDIPSNAADVTLTARLFPLSGEAGITSLAAPPEGGVFGLAALASDVQYILVLDEDGFWIDTLHWTLSNAQTWNLLEADLSEYRGETIKIQFGTYNDGLNGVSAMYVDEASLVVCP